MRWSGGSWEARRVRQHFAPGLTVDTTHTLIEKGGGEEVKIKTGETV